MRKAIFFIGCFACILVGGMTTATTVSAGVMAVFDAQHTSTEKWRDTWDDGSPSGAKIEVKNNIAEIIGTQREKNYGVIYQYVDWDLDRYPFLEIDVKDCMGEAAWYLLVENQELANGYLKLQEDTRETGLRAYNVKKATGLKGKRRLRIELGITTSERAGNIDLKMKMAQLRLVSSTQAEIVEVEVQEAPDEDVTLQTSLLGWNNRWQSGKNSGAYLTKLTGGKIQLVGDYSNQEFGCVYKSMRMDFSQYPKLEVVVSELEGNLYIIFEGKQFRGGYYRVKPNVSKPGSYVYDLQKDFEYLKGEQEFLFTMGVTTGNPAIPVKDHWVDLYSVKFIGKNDIKLVAGIIPSQLINPPPPLVVPQPFELAELPSEVSKIAAASLDQGSLLKLFGSKYRAQKISEKPSVPSFKEEGDTLRIENSLYLVEFNKKNGVFKKIVDKTNHSEVSMGSEREYLWRIMFKKGDFLNAKDFIAGKNGKFSYRWDKAAHTLHFDYQNEFSKMNYRIVFSEKNHFDIEASFENNGKEIITAVDMPRLCLDYRKLDYFYLPYAMGIRFNQKFFKGKRQWKTTYPLLFADFINWSMDDGGKFSSFLLWKDQPVKPMRINIGYSPAKGECGVYEHGWASYIQPGDQWESQPLRMVVGEQVEVALKRYKRDNGLENAPLLFDKLGKNLFEKVRKGVLLKISLDMNRSFEFVNQYFAELPYGTIVHFVTWWLEGFDKHMPDFWPVNPIFGNNQDFKKSIALAKEKDLVVMPYTNNTFWNESPTLTRVGGPDVVASKNYRNETIFEVYPSGGKGWATSPRHPAVRATGEYIADKFFNEYGIDMLFLDQIGARFIDYDMNASLGNPNDYAQGWVENCTQNVKHGPLQTEQGYDRLIPIMSAFCGLASYTFPESLDYNIWWGEGSWEYFPMAQYLSHENVLLYHHNLAHEVFCDSHKKIAFYLAHGYNMYNGRWVSEWHNQKQWFQLADQIQKQIVSKYVGKPLLNYEQIIPHKLIWSAYPDLGILVNLSETDTYPVLNHAVAPAGFIATNKQGTFLAGHFSRLYGYDLDEPQYFAIEKIQNKIIVTQMQHKSTLVTIPRPKDWIKPESIHVRQGKDEMPLVAITPKAISFHTNSNVTTTGAVKYIIEYNSGQKQDYALKIASSTEKVSANMQVDIDVEGKNLNKGSLENVQLVLSAWMVKRNTPVIKPQDGFLTLSPQEYIKTERCEKLEAGESIVSTFPLWIPSTAEAGDVVWIKAELVSQKGKQVQTRSLQSVLQVDSPFSIGIQTNNKSVNSGEKTKIKISLRNNFTTKVKGKLELHVPKNWKGKRSKIVRLSPQEEKVMEWIYSTPMLNTIETTDVFATFKVNENITTSKSEAIEVSPVWRVRSFEGPRVLVKGKKSIGVLRLITFANKEAYGTIRMNPSKGLELKEKEFKLKVGPGGEQIIQYEVTAQSSSDQEIEVVMEYQKKTETLIIPCPVIETNQARVLQGDWMNCGDENVIMANQDVEVQMQKDLGGRILAFYHRASNANMLYQNYPTVQKIPGSKDWIEYGGINDWFPSGWPGFVWNDSWEIKVIEKNGAHAVVSMKTKTQNGLELERKMTLPAVGRELKLDYTVRNLTDVNRSYLWFNHPDLAPGPYNFAGDAHRIIVPIADPENDENTEVLTEKFNAKIGKDEYRPNEGWVVALDTMSNGYFMQKFDPEQVTKIGVWQDAIFYTMELLTEEEKLKAGESKSFTIYYVVGNKNWEDDL